MNPRRGFTLIELSIVLVVIGLLVGGVFAGRGLIRASELQGTIKEFQSYKTAIGLFSERYAALPGDMLDATSYWGAQAVPASCPNLTNTSPATGTATCDGNGNKRLQMTSGTYYEHFRFWQHLANAGLIEGRFTGVTNSTTANTQVQKPGWNVPGSRLSERANWWITYKDPQTAYSSDDFASPYGHVFYLYDYANVTTNLVSTVMTTQDAYYIDSKLDDGLPETGIVLPRRNSLGASYGQCIVLSGSNYVYNMTLPGIRCWLILLTGF